MHSAHDADALLVAYGAWATPRARRNVCGSAEGAYREGPTASGGLATRLPVATALRVQGVLQRLPEAERRVLQAEYTGGGRLAGRVKADLGVSWRAWRELRDRALGAFAAAWSLR